MRLNTLLLLVGILLTACSDSSDYAMPPEYDYTPSSEAEEPSKAPSTSSLLDIVTPANSEQEASSRDDTGTHNNDELATPPAATTSVTVANKPATAKTTVAKTAPIKSIKPSQPTSPPPPSNKATNGIKELDFSAKEHSPAKVSTVKLDNIEVTHRGNQSQSLYSSSEQGRFHKTNKRGAKIKKSSHSWSCVIDNKNGLLWEGKSQGKWRNSLDRYAIEGGNGSCKLESCTTQSYVNYLNETKLCGRNNWRLPSKAELISLNNTRHVEGEAAINLDFFPNTQTDFYWSHTPFKYAANRSWAVDFSSGYDKSRAKNEAYHLRLVSKN